MKIGNRMRELRQEKNMTLDELSESSGVALATLSRMENNKMPGTLKSHMSICKAINTSIVELYRDLEEENKTIDAVPKQERTEHFIHAHKAKYELLVKQALDKKIMPLMMKIDASGSTQKEQNKYGVEKFVYIMTGTLEAGIGKETFTLKRGDSLYFDASLPHTFKNKTKSEAEAICIISPPAL